MYRIEGQGRRIQAPDSRDSVFKFSFVGSTGLAKERTFRDPNIQYNKNLWCRYGGSTTGFLVHARSSGIRLSLCWGFHLMFRVSSKGWMHQPW